MSFYSIVNESLIKSLFTLSILIMYFFFIINKIDFIIMDIFVVGILRILWTHLWNRIIVSFTFIMALHQKISHLYPGYGKRTKHLIENIKKISKPFT